MRFTTKRSFASTNAGAVDAFDSIFAHFNVILVREWGVSFLVHDSSSRYQEELEERVTRPAERVGVRLLVDRVPARMRRRRRDDDDDDAGRRRRRRRAVRVSVVSCVSVFLGGFFAASVGAFASRNHQPLDDATTRVEDTWAVIIDASRFWFNYRHGANALSMYRSVKRMGVPDSRIVLMLADDHACDARNPAHGRVYNDAKRGVELYGDDVEVDYRGTEVTPENVVRVLTNRHEDGTPRSKKLSSGPKSNVLIYITGHGGDGFIKFQDQTELRDEEIADAIAHMHAKGRYNEILFMAETCQAATLAKAIRSPRVLAISSSDLGESSYSHHSDPEIGVHVIDRFTYYILDFFEKLKPDSGNTVGELMRTLTRDKLLSRAVLDDKTFKHRDARSVKLTDFFGYVSTTRVLPDSIDWFRGAETASATSASVPREAIYRTVDISELGFR